jgi:protein-S-isoprenylcysteine O-methyltransferase Ste14
MAATTPVHGGGFSESGDAHVQWQESDAMLKALSVLGLLLMVAALLGLLATHSLFSGSLVIIAVQGAAVALMVWARVTFGRRSFHAAANPTEGGLVTAGPYRFVRHPICTAVCLFVFAGALGHVSLPAVGLAPLVFLGALGRMLPEERLVLQRYPEYADYAARTKRMLPLVF